MGIESVQKYRRERLMAAAEKAGGKAALGRLLGGKDGAYIGQMERGERPVSEKVVAKLEAKPGFKGWFDANNPSHLGSSTNEPVKLPENIEHASYAVEYAGSPKYRGVAAVMAVAKVDGEGFYEAEVFKEEGAGGWVPTFSESDTYALKIKGDGLAPAIDSGMFLLVEPNAEAQNGDRVVLGFKDGRKAVRKLLFRRADDVQVMPVQGGPVQTFDLAELEFIDPVFGIVEASRWKATLPEQKPRRALAQPTRGGNHRPPHDDRDEGAG